jgi:TetR/AcrR family transcriptional regulator, transcriptional repressor for nem operon
MSKTARTKAFILEKTAPLFNIKGFAGTSLLDMVYATGLTKGSIYGNFANKEEVALAVFDHNVGKMMAIFDAELSKHSTPKGKLMSYVTVYDNFANLPFPEGGCPLLNTATESDDTQPQLKKRAREVLVAWKTSIVEIIRAGMERKEFKKTSDPEQLAISIIALLEGGMMISKLLGKDNYSKAVVVTLQNLIHDLIIHKPG